MCNYSQGVNDESVKRNAEFLGNSGVKAYIIRTTTGKCCEWCTNKAGKYEYGQEPKDIYRRHANCDCIVEYVTDGKSQNVHTKQWATKEEIEARKNIEPPKPTKEDVEKLKNLNVENGGGSGIIYKNSGKKEVLINIFEKALTSTNSTEIVRGIADNHAILGEFTPKELKQTLEGLGHDVKPLGRGNFKSVPFEKGGGFRFHFGGDGTFRYHPEERSHHKGAYYRIKNGRENYIYDIDGNEKKD